MFNLYPHHIFFDKVINQITHRKNKLWRFLPASKMSLLGIGEQPSKDVLKERLKYILGDVYEVVQHISKEERLIIIESANQTLAHEFDYLGSGPIHMPQIHWHEDFKTGFSWKRGVYYLKQRNLTENGADIKVPWELSRGHHLLWLGEAYLITKDEKYAKEVVDEIEDWWRENPFLYSVNWTCTMDVAIRAVNWMYAVGMMLDSSNLDESFLIKYYRSLYQHAWFIYNNLERTIPYSNNHLFSDLAGLLYLAILYEETKQGKKWLNYTTKALFEEIRCQILPSGAQYERSLSYHRLMTEMVASSVQLLKRQKMPVPADIEYRMASMFTYISAYTKPNGLAPLVEDNDDGRFLPFVRRDFRNHSYLLNRTSAETLFLTIGTTAIHYNKNIGKTLIFNDVGHCMVRKGDAFLFVTNGEQSAYPVEKCTIGTHTHNDKLSFELSLGEDDIIVDPGAYIYTPKPEKCKEFRSTAKHNTVVVDDEEQNLFVPNAVFSIEKNSLATSLRANNETCIEGAYRTYKGSLSHQRVFIIEENYLHIVDNLAKQGSAHCATFSLHLSEYMQPQLIDNVVILFSDHYSIKIEFETEGHPLKLKLIDDTVSPSYGVLRDAKTIKCELCFDEEASLKTSITWQRKK